MNASLTFQGQISRIKKRILLHRVANAIINCVVLFSLCYGVGMGIDLWTDFSAVNQPWFLMLAVIISLGFTLILAVLNKRRFIDTLIEIDHRLNFHDSVSTAFEYRHLGKKSELSELLEERVAQHLFGLDSRKLFPFKFSWQHVLLGVLILLHVLIAIQIRNPSKHDSGSVSVDAVRLVDAYLHEQMNHEKRRSKGAGANTRRKLYNDLEKLSQDLRRSSSSRKQFADSIGRMLKEIESGQTVVAKELGEQLKLHNIEEIPVQAMQQFQNWSLTNLKQLQMMVDRMFNHQMPETVSERLAILQEQQQLKDVLDNLLNDMDDTESLGKSEDRSNRDKRMGKSGSGSGLNSAKGNRSVTSENDVLSDSDTVDAHSDESNRSDGVGDGDNGFGDAEGSDDVVSSTAGKGAADGSLKSQRPIDSAKGAAVQDRTQPSSKDYYRAHIRTLTSIGQAKVDNRQVIQTYQKEVEGILKKENIPLNYREYIRNYFLSIGLRKEK